MLYEEAKRQTYAGLTSEQFQWVKHVYVDYDYLDESSFWWAFNYLLSELSIDAVNFFDLFDRFDHFHVVADSYFRYYAVPGHIVRILLKMIGQVDKHDKAEGRCEHAI